MKPLYAFFVSIVLYSCTPMGRPNIENNEGAVQARLLEQQEKWNAGDLEGFMSYYWNSDSLCFLSKRGMTCGWNNIYNNYKKGYNTKEKMGRLDFEILKSETMNDSTHFLVGRWQVTQTNDTLGGSFNLIWKQINGQWFIVFDHTS